MHPGELGEVQEQDGSLGSLEDLRLSNSEMSAFRRDDKGRISITKKSELLVQARMTRPQLLTDIHVHVLMRDEKEGRKKQGRSNKQQGKATQHTQGSHFS